MILFIHQVLIFLIARESVLIFWDEKVSSSMSQMLERKNLHVNEIRFLAQDVNNGEAQANGGGAPKISDENDPNESQAALLRNSAVDGNQANHTEIYRMTYQIKLTPETKMRAKVALFAVILAFAFLNFPNEPFVASFWAVVGSIVCPLIVFVIPGCFFYQIRKAIDEDNKPYRWFGSIFALFGLLLLPFYLTLSTKNLFSPLNGFTDINS